MKFAGVVVFPSFTDISDPARKSTGLHEALDERGVPYLDLHDLVRERHDRGEETYGPAHLTAIANSAVAGEVLEWLRVELDL